MNINIPIYDSIIRRRDINNLLNNNSLYNNYNTIFTDYSKKSRYIEYYENISDNFVSKKNPPGKTIWILWLQGWNNAPWYIHKIKESWIKYNPEWNIELVSRENLSDYININIPPNASHQAISDIIRLNLLYHHGGVWADSTMLCMMPLDLWVYDVLQPSGFWMYHGTETEGPDAPASWFLISMKHNYIISKWKDACNNYWLNNTSAHIYRWMDELFMNLINSDSIFTNMWRNTPYLNCDDEGQAHMLAGKCFDNDNNLKEILEFKPPFAVKLKRHDGAPDEITEEFKKTNMYFAIECALNRKDSEFTLPHIVYKPVINIIKKEKILVVADCNNKNEILELNKICNENDIQMIIFDKCNFGKHVSNELYCRPLKNVGREQSTYLYFMMTYYDFIPKTIYLIPGNIHKHNRLEVFLHMIEDPNFMGRCEPLRGENNFELIHYDGVTLMPASIKPFKKWYENYIGTWNDDTIGPCWSGIMQTNKERILRHSKEFYSRLYNDMNKYNNGEVGHYGERSMAAIF